MALIKCKSCGHVMSDRAEFCPHCGCPKEFCIKEETSIKEDTPAKEESSATTPKEVSMPENFSSNANNGEATITQDIDGYDDSEENTANRGLLGIVGILTIIALVFAGFLLSGNRYYNGKTLKFTIDTCADDTDSYVDDSLMADSTSGLPTAYDSNTADTITSSNDYINNEQIEEEEIGFKSNVDVMDYVVGNSYSYNGITLRITDEAVYANDNKISTSKLVFRKISLNKGIITARPSISITVVRDENRLVDNNNGDTYY